MSKLVQAIKFGDLDAVKSLIKNGEDINQREGKEPMLCLAAKGPGNLPPEFRQLGPDFEEVVEPEHKGGYASIVSVLIENGADVNACGEDGNTPLISAVKGRVIWSAGYAEKIAKILIDAGANLNAGDKHGNTPLTVAAEHGDTGIVEMLIDAGANLDVADKNGDTSLHKAINRINTSISEDFCHELLKIIELLLKANANANILNKKGLTPLDCVRNAGSSFRNKFTVKIESLLKSAGAIHGQKWMADLEEAQRIQKIYEAFERKENQKRLLIMQQKEEWRKKGKCEECGKRLTAFDKLQKRRMCSDCRKRYGF